MVGKKILYRGEDCKVEEFNTYFNTGKDKFYSLLSSTEVIDIISLDTYKLMVIYKSKANKKKGKK